MKKIDSIRFDSGGRGKTSEVKLEQMFKKYDTDQSGYIEYAEFKKIWVRMANVKKELTDRGIKIPKVATNRMLYTMLEQILEVEEDRYGWE